MKNIVNVTPSEFYNLSTDKQEKVITRITKQLASTPNVLISKMYDHVNKTMKHYKTDFLIHDIRTLENESDNTYVWFIHECGSFLVKLNHDFNSQLTESQEWLQAVKNNYGNRSNTKTFLVNQKENTLKRLKGLTDNNITFTCKYHDIEEAIKDKTKHLNGMDSWDVMQGVKKNSVNSVNELIDIIRSKTVKAV
jgi:hypothetical protein